MICGSSRCVREAGPLRRLALCIANPNSVLTRSLGKHTKIRRRPAEKLPRCTRHRPRQQAASSTPGQRDQQGPEGLLPGRAVELLRGRYR